MVYQKGRASSTRDLYCVARGVVRVVRANVDSRSVSHLKAIRGAGRRLAAAAGKQTRRAGVQDELLGEGPERLKGYNII